MTHDARRHFFTLHEMLIMAALSALGGVTSSLVSIVRAAVHALVVVPGGLQYLAGIHVLWLIIALGLIRKPGAATVTGLLKGVVELLSGNPLGPIVLLYGAVAGLCIDVVWLLSGRRHRRLTYMLGGGIAAAANVPMFAIIASLPGHKGVFAGLTVMAIAAFGSGLLLGGLLGWWLLRALGRAGAAGANHSLSTGTGFPVVSAESTTTADPPTGDNGPTADEPQHLAPSRATGAPAADGSDTP